MVCAHLAQRDRLPPLLVPSRAKGSRGWKAVGRRAAGAAALPPDSENLSAVDKCRLCCIVDPRN